MIVALAGRRIDAPKADSLQFPPENAPIVRKRISEWLTQQRVHTVVCSAACGADLLALSVAEDLGIACRIVLPFPRHQFRAASVVDRGQEWGTLFDAILDRVESQGKVLILDDKKNEADAYSEANHVIIEWALSIAAELDQPVSAVVVWNGVSRGAEDITAGFLKEARDRGLEVQEISTR